MTNIPTRYDLILGSKRLSNYFWASIIFLGGSGFLIAGLSSYFKIDLFYLKTTEISFIPQGITMTFYGFIGLLTSIFLFLQILFDVGGGYNSYNQDTRKIEIFRLGFPFQNGVYIKYNFIDIKSIILRVEDGLNPRREIYLQTQNNGRIPLTSIGEPQTLSIIEEEAVELADFLNVPLDDW